MHYAREREPDLVRGRLAMGRKAKATSSCLINVVRVRPRCPCRPHYLGRLASYTVYDQKLETVDSVKYLAVVIDSRLKFSGHIDTTCKKSNYCRLGDCYVLVALFFLFSRPLIFRHHWADFHETLPHDAVWPEIIYLLWGICACPLKNLRSKKKPNLPCPCSPVARPLGRHVQ